MKLHYNIFKFFYTTIFNYNIGGAILYFVMNLYSYVRMNAISFAYEDFTSSFLAISSLNLKKRVMEIEHVQQREKEGKMGKMDISMLWSQKVIVTSTIFLHLVLFSAKVWKTKF